MSYTKFSAKSAGLNEIISAPGEGRRIDVYGIFFQCTTDCTVTLRTGMTEGGDLTGAMAFNAGTGMYIQPITTFDGLTPTFQCVENEPLNVLLGQLQELAGAVYYEIVTV